MADRNVDLLDEVLSGETTHDDAPASVRSLATLATSLSTEFRPMAAPEDVRYRLRDALLAQMATPDGRLDRLRDRVDRVTAGWRHSARVATATALASTLIGTTGVAAAAQSALPGDLLYGIKHLTEDARLAFASGDVEQGRLHLAFARERLEEVEDGVHRLPSDTLADTLGAMDDEAVAGANQLLAAHASSGERALLDELAGFTAQQTARLLAVRNDLPLAAVGAAETSTEVLRRIDAQVDVLLQPACQSCEPDDGAADGGPPVIPQVVLPDEGPAVAPGCQCVGEVPADPSPPREDPTPSTPPAQDEDEDVDPAPPAEPDEVPPADPDPPTDGETPDEGGLSDDLSELVDPLGDAGDLVDDLLEDTGLDDPIDEVGEVVDDVGDTVDDVIDPDPDDGGLLDTLLGG